MLVTRPLTPLLRGWLRGAQDDEHGPELVVTPTADGRSFTVLRADGSEPSETEQIEVAALCAAEGSEEE